MSDPVLMEPAHAAAPARILAALVEIAADEECFHGADGENLCEIEGCRRCELTRAHRELARWTSLAALLPGEAQAIVADAREYARTMPGFVETDEGGTPIRRSVGVVLNDLCDLLAVVQAAPPAKKAPPIEETARAEVHRAEGIRLGIEAARLTLHTGIKQASRVIAEDVAVTRVFTSMDADALVEQMMVGGVRLHLSTRRMRDRWAVLHDRLLHVEHRAAGNPATGARDAAEAAALTEALRRWERLPVVEQRFDEALMLLMRLVGDPTGRTSAAIEAGQFVKGVSTVIAKMRGRVYRAGCGQMAMVYQDGTGCLPFGARAEVDQKVRVVVFREMEDANG